MKLIPIYQHTKANTEESVSLKAQVENSIAQSKFFPCSQNLGLSFFVSQGNWGVSYRSETTSSRSLKVDQRAELPLTEIWNWLQIWAASLWLYHVFSQTHTLTHSHTETHTHSQKAISSNARRTERLSLAARGNPKRDCDHNQWLTPPLRVPKTTHGTF